MQFTLSCQERFTLRYLSSRALAERLERWSTRLLRPVRFASAQRLFRGLSGRSRVYVQVVLPDHGAASRGIVVVQERKRLSVVIVSYRQPDPLACLLYAFASQTLQTVELVVLHDGPDQATRFVVEHFSATHPSMPCRYIETANRHNDYGHTLRRIGLEQASGDYVLLTNGDNYYAARFVEYLFAAIDQHDLDVVVFNMIHSHAGPGGVPVDSYNPFYCEPIRHSIDIGALVARTAVARQAGFRDISHDGDATYVEDVVVGGTGSLRIGKLDKTLLVHN